MFWLFGAFMASDVGSPTRSAKAGAPQGVVPPEEIKRTKVLAELRRMVDEFERFDRRRPQEELNEKYLSVLAFADTHEIKTHALVDHMDAVRRYHVVTPPQARQPAELSSSVAPYQLAESH